MIEGSKSSIKGSRYKSYRIYRHQRDAYLYVCVCVCVSVCVRSSMYICLPMFIRVYYQSVYTVNACVVFCIIVDSTFRLFRRLFSFLVFVILCRSVFILYCHLLSWWNERIILFKLTCKTRRYREEKLTDAYAWQENWATYKRLPCEMMYVCDIETKHAYRCFHRFHLGVLM